MALQLERPTEYGVPCVYWVLGVINIQPRHQSVHVVLDGYPNETYRSEGARALAHEELSLAWSDALADGGRAALYAAVKAQAPDWSGAQDA